MYELIAAVVGPLVATFLAGVGLWLREWRGRREREHLQEHALNRAAEEVAFLEAWARASERIADPTAHQHARAMLQADLERVYVLTRPRLSAYSGAETEAARQRMTFGGLLRVLFLARPMRSRLAKAVRVVYYFSLLWTLVWAAAISAATVERSMDLVNVTVAILLVALFAVGPAVGFAALAGWLDRRAVQRGTRLALT